MSLHDLRPYPEECERVRELLGAREDGLLAPGEEVMLRDHLDECEECRMVASWMSSVDGLGRVAEEMPGPGDAYFAGLRTSVMARVEGARQEQAVRGQTRPAWLRWPVLAPTALVVVLAGLFTLRQGDHAGPIERRAATPQAELSADDPALTRPGKDEREAAIPPPVPIDPRARADEGRGRELVPETALLQDADATTLAERTFTPAKRSPVVGLASEAPAAAPQEISTVAQAFELARASQGTRSETVVLTRLLDLLEGDPRTTVESTDPARSAAPSSPLRAQGQAEGRVMQKAEPQAPSLALDDSIAVHLQQRIPELEDADLLARIEAWLQSR